MILKLKPKDRHTGCLRCNKLGCCWSREKHGESLGHWIWTAELCSIKLKAKLSPKRLYKKLTALNYSKIDDVEVDGIDTKDYPDFCDAYIASATYKNREMTEVELERLNEDRDFVYDHVIAHLF